MARRKERRRVSLKERRKLREEHKRERIVKDARKVYDSVYRYPFPAGVVTVDRASCVYQAACVIYAAYHHGVDLMVQAGGAAWPRIPVEEDDGTVDSHFGYEWQGLSSASSRAAIDAGHLPEIHVWAAEVRTMSLVDTSTRYVQEQCNETTDLEWRMPKPPDYIWSTAEDMPDRWYYQPSETATLFIRDAVRNAIADIGRVLGGKLP